MAMAMAAAMAVGRCQAVAAAPEAQPARGRPGIVSLNSLDKLNEDVLDARASPVTVATGAAALERASTPPPSPPKTTTTYVEGAVSVLARCRSGPKLQWRPAAFSVDRVHGNLRIFRSDDERRAWHAAGVTLSARASRDTGAGNRPASHFRRG